MNLFSPKSVRSLSSSMCDFALSNLGLIADETSSGLKFAEMSDGSLLTIKVKGLYFKESSSLGSLRVLQKSVEKLLNLAEDSFNVIHSYFCFTIFNGGSKKAEVLLISYEDIVRVSELSSVNIFTVNDGGIYLHIRNLKDLDTVLLKDTYSFFTVSFGNPKQKLVLPS